MNNSRLVSPFLKRVECNEANTEKTFRHLDEYITPVSQME